VWDESTLQLVFSTTKGIVATCIARLVQAGALSYDDPVARTGPSSPPTARSTSRSAR
jgi:CubicO group peptidase (beta-lactamase class C family)